MAVSIAVDMGKRLAPVAPELYGGLIEHLGRNVYGGIYDPSDPTADADGFRQDVLEAVRELDMPVSRYPGGCFTDTWHWEEGIGERAKRPARLDFAWKQHEPNIFGIDEFMKWAEKAGSRPMITLNLSTRGIMEALDTVMFPAVPATANCVDTTDMKSPTTSVTGVSGTRSTETGRSDTNPPRSMGGSPVKLQRCSRGTTRISR